MVLDMEQSADRRQLTAYQAAMIDGVLAAPTGSVYGVWWPPGSGKTYASAALIRRVSEGRATFRSLVVAPAALGDQWAYVIRAATDGGLGETVSRTRMRELADRPSEVGVWPRRGCFVISRSLLAVRDVDQLLTAQHWDLVIVDEAHQGWPRTEHLLRMLSAGEGFGKCVLLSATPQASTSEYVTFQSVVGPEAMREQLGLGPRTTQVVLYPPATDFNAAVRDLRIALAAQVHTSAERFVVSLLEQMAASSPAAFVASIRRMRSRWAYGSASAVFEQEEDDSDAVTSTNADRGLWTAELMDFIVKVAERVEECPDPKMDAFLAVARDCLSACDRLCVFSSFRDTAEYVRGALEDEGVRVRLCHGGMTYDERRQSAELVEMEGGVLVATVGGAAGLVVAQARAVINYDLPQNVAALETLWRVIEAGSRTEAHMMLAFVDASRDGGVEVELARRHGFIGH